MIKKLMLCVLTIVVITAKSQITYSYTIPDAIPEYDGTYEDFGQNHFFYPNAGEIRFANDDQSDASDDVKYYTKYTYPAKYLLRNTNMSFLFFRRDTTTGSTVDSLHRIDLEMERGSSSAVLARVDTQNTCVLNYFNQWFGSTGRTDVRGGASIAVQSIYPNIDMVYTSNNTGVKIFYVVYPGGDPNLIILHFDGAKSTGISGGELIVQSNWDQMKFIKPRMYQYTYASNIVTPVNVCNATWQNVGTDMYGITTTSSWNSTLPLIIEVSQGVATQITTPGLKWSTYFGGSMQDYIRKARSDGSNNLFAAGNTTSADFPVNAGPMVVSTIIGSIPTSATTSDGFVAKFNAAGVLKWATYVGGSNAEQINDFDFKAGDIYCAGVTTSYDLPVKTKTSALNNSSYSGGNSDGFVFQLDASGLTNNWLTYFGGNKDDIFNACKFDATGEFFVVGSSKSTNMSPVGGAGTYTQIFNTAQPSVAFDCIILKFNASTYGLDWFTFYGTDVGGIGSYVPSDEFIGLDISGTDVYVCGYAGGTNLPGTINSKYLSGTYDGILTKFNTSGVLSVAKYTNGNEWNNAVKVYNSKVYTCGEAIYGMAVVNSGNYYYNSLCTLSDVNACFAVHSLNLATTSHCTYLGDGGYDEAIDIQFAANGIFYISGGTSAPSFPVTSIGTMYTANQKTGATNYFIAAFEENNTNLVWSTCLGSYNVETDGSGNCASMALDGQGFLHLCGASNSYTYFPLDDGNNIPYFQAYGASNPTNNATFNGTITRFDLASLMVSVGIKDFPNTSFSFGLYPNPTAKYLTVDNQVFLNQNLRYAIYDLQGKKLSEGNLNTGQQKNIDVSNLSQGVYFINLSNGTRTFSNKFVKTDD